MLSDIKNQATKLNFGNKIRTFRETSQYSTSFDDDEKANNFMKVYCSQNIKLI